MAVQKPTGKLPGSQGVWRMVHGHPVFIKSKGEPVLADLKEVGAVMDAGAVAKRMAAQHTVTGAHEFFGSAIRQPVTGDLKASTTPEHMKQYLESKGWRLAEAGKDQFGMGAVNVHDQYHHPDFPGISATHYVPLKWNSKTFFATNRPRATAGNQEVHISGPAIPRALKGQNPKGYAMVSDGDGGPAGQVMGTTKKGRKIYGTMGGHESK